MHCQYVWRGLRAAGWKKRSCWRQAHCRSGGVALLNRFAAERRSCYTECIMTEGLGISLFILFIVCLFRFEEEGRRRDLIYTGILIFLCVSLRKQLLVTALTAVGVCLFVQLPRAVRTRKTAACARPWREILQLMLTALAALLCSFLLDAGFNFSRYGIFTPHTGNYMGIDCVLIYTSEAKDAELISDPELRSMFSQIREQAADRKLLYGDAGSDADWVALTEHFSDSYDVIGYDIMNPVFTAYLNRSESADGQNKLRYYRDLDGLEKELRNCLLRQDREKFFNLWLQNIRKGFVNTVLKVGHTANWAALVLYIVFFILLAAQGMRKKDARMQRPVLFALTVVLAVALNAVTVGAVIFPQTRYMIYGMGLFYSAAGYLAVLRAAR